MKGLFSLAKGDAKRPWKKKGKRHAKNWRVQALIGKKMLTLMKEKAGGFGRNLD